jgi:cytochrome P450
MRFVGYGEAVWLADPAAAHTVLTADARLFHSGDKEWLEPAFGKRSLILMNEDIHLRHRKLMLPAFHGERVRKYGDVVGAITEREVARWPIGEPFRLRSRMSAIVLETLLRAGFGIEEDTRVDEFRRRLRRFNAAFNWLAWGPWIRRDFASWSPWAEFKRRREGVDEMIFEEIRDRRRDPALSERTDLLSVLVQGRDDGGRPMSDRELRDEMVTLFMAGHHTTATSLGWIFHFLLRDVKAMRRLHGELAEPESPYLDAVVTETMRLRPVVPLISRVTTAPVELCGYELPAGTQLAIAIVLLHHRPEIYPEPFAFRPERFVDAKLDGSAYLPFGLGRRRCVGASLATLEMKCVTRTVLQTARLRAARAAPEAARARGMPTLGPARGTEVILDGRAARGSPSPHSPLVSPPAARG